VSHTREFWDDEECRALVSGCGVLVGLHPDQATEAVVDAALRLGKPMAVVPCCVFAGMFPHRRLGGDPGRPVRTYADLCEYLAAKHPAIETHHLPCEGRNKVLFLRRGAAGAPLITAPPAPGAPACAAGTGSGRSPAA